MSVDALANVLADASVGSDSLPLPKHECQATEVSQTKPTMGQMTMLHARMLYILDACTLNSFDISVTSYLPDSVIPHQTFLSVPQLVF